MLKYSMFVMGLTLSLSLAHAEDVRSQSFYSPAPAGIMYKIADSICGKSDKIAPSEKVSIQMWDPQSRLAVISFVCE